MKSRLLKARVLAGVLARVLACALLAPANAARAAAGYAQAMQEELTKLGLPAQCEELSATRHRCRFPVRSGVTERALTGYAVYDQTTASVYLYVERLLSLPPQSPARGALLQRMMELNWELLVGKFEWNPRSGEVRLSAVLSTDSNFDRRAFRSLVRSLDALAARYRGELRSLQAGDRAASGAERAGALP